MQFARYQLLRNLRSPGGQIDVDFPAPNQITEIVRQPAHMAGLKVEASRLLRSGAQLDDVTTAYIKQSEKRSREVLEQALAAREQTTGAQSKDTVLILVALANVLIELDDSAEARGRLDEATQLNANLRDTSAEAEILNELGRLHFAGGQYADALSVFEHRLVLLDQLPEVELLEKASTRNNIAGDKLGPKHHLTALTGVQLAEALLALGEFGEALRQTNTAHAVNLEIYGPSHLNTAHSDSVIGLAEFCSGKAQGKQRFETAVAQFARELPKSGPRPSRFERRASLISQRCSNRQP